MTKEVVKLIEVKFDEPILETLFQRKILNFNTYKLLKIAFDNGGYIAGGFASQFARLFLTREKTNCLINYNQLRYGYLSDINQHKFLKLTKENRVIWKPGHGDIDVWFETSEGCKKFLDNKGYNDIVVNNSITNRSIKGFAVEHIVFGNEMSLSHGKKFGQIIQFIDIHHGSIEKVVNDFDIYNACCAIKGNSIFYPENFEWLVNERKLHIINWDAEFILNRIAKWSIRHDFGLGLTPHSIQSLNDSFDKLQEKYVSGQMRHYDNKMSPHTFVCQFRGIYKDLSEGTLLKLSTYTPIDSYNFIFSELMKRCERLNESRK